MDNIPIALSEPHLPPATSASSTSIAWSWSVGTLGASTFSTLLLLAQPALHLPKVLQQPWSLALGMLALTTFGVPSLWILLQLTGTQHSLAEANQNFARAAAHVGMCLLGLSPLVFLYAVTGPVGGTVLRALLTRAALPTPLWKASTQLGEAVIFIFVALYLTVILQHAF